MSWTTLRLPRLLAATAVLGGLLACQRQAAPITAAEPRDPRPTPGASYRHIEVPNLATRHDGIDWPTFLGPARDSKSPEQGILTQWPVNGPPLVWQVSLDLGYAPPTVSRGRLFLFDAYRRSARLRCLASETGQELWKFEYPSTYEDLYGYDNGPRCAPIVDDDRVYLFGAEGMLHCLRVTDGEVIWKFDTNEQFGVVQNFFGVGSAPLVEGDLLITHVGGSPPASQRVPPGQLDLVKPNGSGVVAFNKYTGEVCYQIGDELASYSSPVAATLGDRRWCFVFARGGLLGFEPRTGAIDFHFPWRARTLESVNASNPVIVDRRVFISETYGPGAALLRVAPGEHEVIWEDDPRRRDKAMQAHWMTPIHLDGYLYGSSGRHTENAELRCIEFSTGKVMWSQPGLTRSSLLYVDGHLVCLTEVGKLLLLKVNPQRMELIDECFIIDPDRKVPQGLDQATAEGLSLVRYPAWGAPVLSHGLLYLRGNRRLVCLELIPAP